MKAPVFSAYAPDKASAQTTLTTLANPPDQPATTRCPKCDGSGTNHHKLAQRGGWIHSGDIHECYQCEGLGYVRATT